VAWLELMRQAHRARQQWREVNRLSDSMRGTPAWRMTSRLLARAHRIARDAWRNRVRHAHSDRAVRMWDRIWLRISEVTSSLAARLMDRLPQRSAARIAVARVHHTATQDVAHVRGILPWHQRLPRGSYELPDGHRASARLKAAAAAEHGDASRLTDMAFLAQAGVVRRPRPAQAPRPAGRRAASRPAPGPRANGAA
jgi:hypothetical protein